MTKSYKATKSPAKVAIILRCPDLRLIAAHKGFISEELDLAGRSYYSLKRAGGAIAFARASEMSDDFKSIFSEINMFLELHPEISYIIIINHQDCRKYDKVIDRATAPKDVERDDLLKAAHVLTGLFPHIQIGAYYAKFTDAEQTEVAFETVFENNPTTSLRKS
ncbi:MAG: hypothetical protein NTW11_04045 [Candidatus Staskawiczbacteria bacterium]|nr:hypothetical protein [Candidatus Staskawiczbacteria bacterium]